MAIITERSPLLKKLVEKSGNEHHNLEKAENKEGNVCKAKEPLLGNASQEDDVPNGGWGWIVTLAAFIIWVRRNRPIRVSFFSPFFLIFLFSVNMFQL